MKTLFAHIKQSARTPLLAAALIATLGAGSLYALCPRTLIVFYERSIVWCGFIAEVDGMCLMDCVETPTGEGIWF